MPKPFDIREHPSLIEAINRELTYGNIVELKTESDNIAVIKIDRKAIHIEKKNKK